MTTLIATPTRMLVTALLAALLLSVLPQASDASSGTYTPTAQAGWTDDGWFQFGGRAKMMTRSFVDRSPDKTQVKLFLQKKPGKAKCRAQIIATKGRETARSPWISKHARTHTRIFSGHADWSVDTKRTTVTVRTNGRCIWRIYAK